MAKVPTTWNDNVSAEVGLGEQPSLLNLDTRGLRARAGGLRALSEGISAGAQQVVRQMKQGEEDFNSSAALHAYVQYGKSVNVAEAQLRTLQGLAAVQAQPVYSSELYRLRDVMGSALPNRDAQDKFLAKTAEFAVRSDQEAAGFATRELLQWKADSLNAAEQLALDTARQNATSVTSVWLQMGEAADVGQQRAELMGNIDRDQIANYRNASAAAAFSIAAEELIRGNDGVTLKNLVETVKRTEGGEQVLSWMAANKPAIMANITGWLQTYTISSEVSGYIAKSPLYRDLGGGKKQAYPAGMFDIQAVSNEIQKRRQSQGGDLPDMVADRYMAYLGQRRQQQAAVFADTMTNTAAAVSSAWIRNRDAGMGPMAAFNKARREQANSEWSQLMLYAPDHAARMLDHAIALGKAAQAQREVDPPSPKEWQALVGIYDKLQKKYENWPLQARPEDYEAAASLLHPRLRDKFYADLIRQRDRADKGGMAAMRLIPRAVAETMKSDPKLTELYPPDDPISAEKRLIIQDRVIDWYNDYRTKRGVEPAPETIRTMIKFYGQDTTIRTGVPQGAIHGNNLFGRPIPWLKFAEDKSYVQTPGSWANDPLHVPVAEAMGYIRDNPAASIAPADPQEFEKIHRDFVVQERDKRLGTPAWQSRYQEQMNREGVPEGKRESWLKGRAEREAEMVWRATTTTAPSFNRTNYFINADGGYEFPDAGGETIYPNPNSKGFQIDSEYPPDVVYPTPATEDGPSYSIDTQSGGSDWADSN